MTKFNAAFWRWFGKSKVVDAEGRPLVVYHGTNRKFWEFKESLPERLGDPEGVVAGRCRMGGFYFTTDKRIARGFGKRVIAAYLRAERIFDYENPRQIEVLVRYLRTLPTFAAWDERDVRDGDWKIMERSEELQDFLRARYDSYFVNEHAPEGYANKSIVVFSPTQIKSATGNRGTWDPTDADIRRNPQQFQKAYSPAQIMSIYRSGKIPLDGRKVDAMVRWLRAGKKLPAIVRDKKTGDIIDGMHRAAATEEFERNIRHNPEAYWGRAGSGILFTCKNLVFLTLRSAAVEQPHTWGIPGGSCAGEGMYPATGGQSRSDVNAARESAANEAREELGYLPRGSELGRVIYSDRGFTYTTFLVELSQTEASRLVRDLKLNWENDEASWFSRDEALALPNLHFGARYVLERLP